MKTSISILLAFISSLGMAQQVISPEFIRDGEQKNSIRLNASGYYLSGDLPREFTSKFTRGGFIDSTLKSDVLGSLHEVNRMGAELESSISYYAYSTHFFGKPNWGWFVSAGTQEHYGGEFGKDLFQMVFFGNRGFAGDTAQLGPASFTSLSFSKFSIGTFNKENHSRFSLSFIAGHQFTTFKANNADLYTAANGSELQLELNETWRRSDTANTSNGAINGAGIATDIVFYLNTGQNRSVRFPQGFRISLENLGFIRWNSNSLLQSKDSTYRYTGFEVTDLLNGISEPFSQTDLSDTLGITYNKESFTQWLPFTFNASLITETFSDKKIQALGGLRMRAFIHYKPMVYLGLQVNPISSIAISSYGAFGGYGGFRGGLQCSAKAGKYLRVSGGTGNIAGWLSKKAYGQDLYLTLSAQF